MQMLIKSNTIIELEKLTNKKVRKPRADKGMSRKHYIKNRRLIKEQSKQLERRQKDIDRFEKLEVRKEKKTRNDYNVAKRLQLLPSPRICSYCNKPKPKSKQWVIKDSYIGCKSCFWRKIIKVKSNGVLPSPNSEALEPSQNNS